MIKTELYKKARKNEILEDKDYLSKELSEIVQAQFHYFWYNVNLKNSLEECAFAHFSEKSLKKLKTQILIFQNDNMHIFKRKNEVQLFNTVILHLLLNKQYSHLTKLTKI